MADRCLHYFKLRDDTGIDCEAEVFKDGVVVDDVPDEHWAIGDNFYVEWRSGSKFDGLRPKDYHDG